ncbi:putative RNA polymerase sigma factor [Nocardia nova SH22a]|uniref:Putative RNA polymerase sigma factor n=1 Tax=Nocardia nova SH22a TaxID=1415166 RepID=W5TTB1_9NOCA|nr:sigma-70 family RNA polymerase sigma factor [Nocardia nova]AHH22168.1 putative RNA polymerase sigma factor [Nocardia nova SH22a]
MRDQEDLARGFEEHRDRLRDIAYRMLGSVSEAEDAVQEAWLRYAGAAMRTHGTTGSSDRTAASDDGVRRSDEIRNPAAWLTTVVSRICLDQLRSRAARPVPVDWTEVPEPPQSTDYREPESEAVLNDSIGRALLVVLRFLSPDERVAFVLHDMFAVPFDEIAPIVDRTPATTKKLASRARIRVRGELPTTTTEFDQHREVVEAFLAASRSGDIHRLLTVLAPDVVRVADPALLPPGVPATVRGADEVAKETVLLRERSLVAGLALVDGAVGIVVAPHGHLAAVLMVTVREDRVAAYEVIAAPERLAAMTITVLPAAR